MCSVPKPCLHRPEKIRLMIKVGTCKTMPYKRYTSFTYWKKISLPCSVEHVLMSAKCT